MTPTDATQSRDDAPRNSTRRRGRDRSAGVRDKVEPFSARYRRRNGSSLMSLNLTPMIDVVFLLLFFFLTVSRFRGDEGVLPAQLPARTPAVATDIPRTPIRIRFVKETGEPDACRVRVDRFSESPIPIGQLAAVLGDVRENRPGFGGDTPVHLLADDDVRWEHVVNAYNAALSARYERIFFTTSR